MRLARDRLLDPGTFKFKVWKQIRAAAIIVTVD